MRPNRVAAAFLCAAALFLAGTAAWASPDRAATDWDLGGYRLAVQIAGTARPPVGRGVADGTAACGGLVIPADGIRWRTMTATAYTAGRESTGKAPGDAGYGVTASGLPARPGVVAVDPSVIPLGTILWVQGYGLAVALDTGSAIRGDRIDVFLPDLDAALAWGVRSVLVALLPGGDGGPLAASCADAPFAPWEGGGP